MKITAGLKGQPTQIGEYEFQAVLLVPTGVGSASVFVLEHLSGYRAILFDGDKVQEAETVQADTFDEAVAKVKGDMMKGLNKGGNHGS